MVYAASKTEGEHAFWNWVKTNKPSFVANTVVPNLNVIVTDILLVSIC